MSEESSGLTSDNSAFIRTILALPEDDAPRLVYADWLNEIGNHDLAEFIRLQVALATGTTVNKETGLPMTKPEMEDREKELFTRHQAEWKAPLRVLGASQVTFRRGFPEGIQISLKDYLRNAQQIHDFAPITSLNVSYSYSDLVESPYLANLTSRHPGYNCMGDAVAGALAESPYLANITSLELRNNHISGAGARTLAESPHLANLTSLSLWNNHIGAAGARALAESPHLTNLTSLSLGDNTIGDAGARALAGSATLPQSCTLRLTDFEVTLAELRESFANRIASRGPTGEGRGR